MGQSGSGTSVSEDCVGLERGMGLGSESGVGVGVRTLVPMGGGSGRGE